MLKGPIRQATFIYLQDIWASNNYKPNFEPKTSKNPYNTMGINQDNLETCLVQAHKGLLTYISSKFLRAWLVDCELFLLLLPWSLKPIKT